MSPTATIRLGALKGSETRVQLSDCLIPRLDRDVDAMHSSSRNLLHHVGDDVRDVDVSTLNVDVGALPPLGELAPGRPTKGRRRATSTVEGASPTTTSCASSGPSSGTVLGASSHPFSPLPQTPTSALYRGAA